MAKTNEKTALATYEDVIDKGLAGAELSATEVELLTSEASGQAILRNILQATTEAEVDAAAGSLNAIPTAALVGTTVTIHDVTLIPSRFADEREQVGGPTIYAVAGVSIDADVTFTWANTRTGELMTREVRAGEHFPMRSQSRSIMAQLVKYARLGVLPTTKVVTRSDHETAAGFYPIWLASPSEVDAS